MALIWMMIGALIGVLFTSLFKINKEDIPEIETIYSDDCMFGKSLYYCKDIEKCTGNPTLCKSSVMK